MASLNFNANNVSPQQSFAPIPAGVYTAQVIDSDVKDTKDGRGKYAALQFELLEGEFANRRVFANITLANANKQAEQIGQSQFSAICHAVGVLQVQDTSQLHGRPLRIKLSIKKDDQYGDKNEVKAYEAVAGYTPAAPAAPASQAPACAPWAR